MTLCAAEKGAPLNAEGYWPDMEGLEHRDAVTEFTLTDGTFFDCGMVHLLTRATLDRLGELYPQGRFEAQRFRRKIVVASIVVASIVVGSMEMRTGSVRTRGSVIQHRRRGSPARHGSLRPLCNDDLIARRAPKDSGILLPALQGIRAI